MSATFPAALSSESAKIRTVKSTYWTLILAVLISVGISLLIGAVSDANWDKASTETVSQIDMSTVQVGVNFGVLIMGIFGVLSVSTEYGTSMMRTMLTAYPRRTSLFSAKTLVVLVISVVVGLIIAFGDLAAAGPFFSKHGVNLSLGVGANLRGVLAVPLYLTIVALAGLALGFIMRHSAAAIGTLVGIMFVAPIITTFLPGRWGTDLNEIMPSNAGNALMVAHHGDNTASPWGALIALIVFAVILLVPALALFKRRDA